MIVVVVMNGILFYTIIMIRNGNGKTEILGNQKSEIKPEMKTEFSPTLNFAKCQSNNSAL